MNNDGKLYSMKTSDLEAVDQTLSISCTPLNISKRYKITKRNGEVRLVNLKGDYLANTASGGCTSTVNGIPFYFSKADLELLYRKSAVTNEDSGTNLVTTAATVMFSVDGSWSQFFRAGTSRAQMQSTLTSRKVDMSGEMFLLNTANNTVKKVEVVTTVALKF